MSLVVPASLDLRSTGHAAHVVLVAPASLDLRSSRHAVHVSLVAPASLDLRRWRHAANLLHRTLFETPIHSIIITHNSELTNYIVLVKRNGR